MVSVVVYDSPPATLRLLVESLTRASCVAMQAGWLDHLSLYFIDNGACQAQTEAMQVLRQECHARTIGQQGRLRVELLSGHGNLGYGRGNNLAIDCASNFTYWLILNPDVELAPDALSAGLGYLATHPESVLLAPAVMERDGSTSHLCKAYPSVFDLLLRGVAPGFVRRWFHKRLADYSLTHLNPAAGAVDISIASGSFMLCRASALQAVGGFDPRYFLYFEDFDLSLRIAAEGVLVWLPAMRIHHAGGQAARKGLWHLWQFARSGIRFFNQHGWRWR